MIPVRTPALWTTTSFDMLQSRCDRTARDRPWAVAQLCLLDHTSLFQIYLSPESVDGSKSVRVKAIAHFSFHYLSLFILPFPHI